MTKLNYILLLLAVALYTKLGAQQLPLYSQYMLNRFIMNPAVAGTTDHFMAMTNNRYQWVGITDAPRTHILTVHGPHKTKNIGLGGAVYTDVTGPTSRTGAYFAYSYHLPLKNESVLAMGISGGILQYKLDGTKITLQDPGDLVIPNIIQSVIVPDFGFGLYWFSENYYAGISVPQFVQNRLNFFHSETQTLSRLTAHYYAFGGYAFHPSDVWEIEPSMLWKYSYASPLQMDFGLKVKWNNLLYGGVTFRTHDAWSLIVGYETPNEKLLFGYAHDFTVTNIKKYSFGSHELYVAARFKSIK